MDMRDLWEGGVFRMVLAGAGFVQNEHGEWARPAEQAKALPLHHGEDSAVSLSADPLCDKTDGSQ